MNQQIAPRCMHDKLEIQIGTLTHEHEGIALSREEAQQLCLEYRVMIRRANESAQLH
jgi:hypothetical protein